MTLGIILGGRIGYVLFYNPGAFRRASARDLAAVEWRHVVPWRLHRLRDRGRPVRAQPRASRSCRSATSPARPAPIGLFLGRIANFINGELWGRPTDVPWAMVFPGGGPLPRHPSQLYEATLEGLVLFVVLAMHDPRRRAEAAGLDRSARSRSAMRIARSICEFFREPDAQLGFLWGGLTMGMLLSMPLLLAGLAFMSGAHATGSRCERDLMAAVTPARSRNPPAHRAARADAGRAHTWRCASAIREHGYYTTRDPFGARGDFITAPEISQMFGELIGLWAAAVWQQMGSPENVRLIELGPGRGTMMSDALRAAQGGAGFPRGRRAASGRDQPGAASAQQRQALSARRRADVVASRRSSDVPDGPAIVLANEFFDALPVHQAVKQRRRLARARDRDRRRRQARLRHRARSDPAVRQAAAGATCGRRRSARSSNGAPTTSRCEIGRRVVRCGGAALIIDYGHVESAIGDTLQAVGDHAFADPLPRRARSISPRMSISQALAQRRREHGRAACTGRSTQGEFLRRLGIEQRAAALKAGAPPDQAAEIDAALARLTDEGDRHGHAVQGRSAVSTQSRHARLRLTRGVRMPHEACRIMIRSCCKPPSLAALPGIRHALLHPRRRRVGRALRQPQWRRRLQRRARQGRREPRPHGGQPRACGRSACSPPIRSIRPTWCGRRPWTRRERPRADAIVTRTPGLAIGVSTADCGPVLFADAAGRRHRRRPCRLARRAHRRARGDDRGHGKARRRPRAASWRRSDRPSASRTTRSGRNSSTASSPPTPPMRASSAVGARPDHAMFDLAGYIAARLARAGVGRVEDLGLCTYADPERFFSYRRVDPSRASPITAGTSTPSRWPISRRRSPSAGWTHSGETLFFHPIETRPQPRRLTCRAGGKSMQGCGSAQSGARAGRWVGTVPSGFGGWRAAVGDRACSACDRQRSDRQAFGETARAVDLAFESIDGPPPAVPHAGRELNDEAGARQIAVVPRETPSTYRVRGYLAAQVRRAGATTIRWVWDVFDADERRDLRIDGEEDAAERPAKQRCLGGRRRADAAPDRARQHGPARGIPGDRPRAAAGAAARSRAAGRSRRGRLDDWTPEAAGIFRIFGARSRRGRRLRRRRRPHAPADARAAPARPAGPARARIRAAIALNRRLRRNPS